MRAGALVASLLVAVAAAGCGDDPPPPPAAVPAPAAGLAAERAGGLTLVPDGPATTARVRAAAGERVTVGLRLANAAGVPRVLALRSDRPWLSVPDAVRVPARQSVPVAAAVTVPPGAGRVLSARVTARAEGDRAAAVSVSYESAVAVRVRVTGGRP